MHLCHKNSPCITSIGNKFAFVITPEGKQILIIYSIGFGLFQKLCFSKYFVTNFNYSHKCLLLNPLPKFRFLKAGNTNIRTYLYNAYTDIDVNANSDN